MDVTSRQIKDGTIQSRDLSRAVRAQLARAGTPGPAGPVGAPGASGVAGIEVVVKSSETNGAWVITACPAGKRVIAGGGSSLSKQPITESRPTSTGLAWEVRSQAGSLIGYAVCALIGP